jgi:hypothetical protein
VWQLEHSTIDAKDVAALRVELDNAKLCLVCLSSEKSAFSFPRACLRSVTSSLARACIIALK